MAVNKERLQLGIDALRSGKYEQGHNRLCTIDGDRKMYCCLGVLTEVAIENGLDLIRVEGTGRQGYEGTGRQGYATPDEVAHEDYNESDWPEYDTLPLAVREWYGFDEESPQLGEEDAVYYNDEDDLHLDEIADLFEKYYLKEGP